MSRSGQQRKSLDTYARLQPRVVHVSEATIRKRWKKLPSASHSAARELIISAKQQSKPRRGHNAIDLATEDSVQEIANNLADRLTRIPYPPGTEEHHFDHEANLHRMSRIEDQLNSNTSSMSLLRTQIAREEACLQQDTEEVKYLEQSLKSNETIRRQQSRTLHPMARGVLADHSNVNTIASQDDEKKKKKSSLMILFEDEDMLPVLEQLQTHLDSMHDNVHDLKEVTRAVEAVSHIWGDVSTLNHNKQHLTCGRTANSPNPT